MTNIFFDQLINIDDLLSELDKHRLPPEERGELLSVIDEILHHHTLNLILTHLPQEHHEEFVSLLKTSPHDPKIMDYVKARVTIDIEAAITTEAQKVKKEILADIVKSKSKSKARK